MRVLITGVTGFIGSHVLRALRSSEHALALLVRNTKESSRLKTANTILLEGGFDNLEVTKGSIKKFDPQVCVHLVWQGIPDYSAVISKQNLYQSVELMDFISKETACKKIIVSGSCFEYGKTKGECSESDSTRTTSFIAWAKQSLYSYLSLLCEQLTITLIWFRIFYVYGPGQRTDALIPTLVEAFLQGKKTCIRNPLNSNDFIYVGDVAEAIRLAIEKKVDSGIYNLGSSKATSVLEVCSIVQEQLSDSKNLLEYFPQQDNDQEQVCFWANITKARKYLGWKPCYSLKAGIQRYIESIQKGRTIQI